MKVLVDEIPNCCEECFFYKNVSTWSSCQDEWVKTRGCTILDAPYEYGLALKYRTPRCPLAKGVVCE